MLSTQNPNYFFSESKQIEKRNPNDSCTTSTSCQVGATDSYKGKVIGRYLIEGMTAEGIPAEKLLARISSCTYQQITTSVPYDTNAIFDKSFDSDNSYRAIPIYMNGISVYAEKNFSQQDISEDCLLRSIKEQQMADVYANPVSLIISSYLLMFGVLAFSIYSLFRIKSNHHGNHVEDRDRLLPEDNEGDLEVGVARNYGSINRPAPNIGIYTEAMWAYLDIFENATPYREQLINLAEQKAALLSQKEKEAFNKQQACLPLALRQSLSEAIVEEWLNEEDGNKLIDEYVTSDMMCQPVYLNGKRYDLPYLRDKILMEGNGLDPVQRCPFTLANLQPALATNEKAKAFLQMHEQAILKLEAERAKEFSELPFDSENANSEDEITLSTSPTRVHL